MKIIKRLLLISDALDIDSGIEVSFDFQLPEIDTVFGMGNLFNVRHFPLTNVELCGGSALWSPRVHRATTRVRPYQMFLFILGKCLSEFSDFGEPSKGRINASFDNYDSEQYAIQMQAQVCNLLDTYYPDEPAVACGGTAPLTLDVSESSVNDTKRVFMTRFSMIVGVICLLMGSTAVLSHRRL